MYILYVSINVRKSLVFEQRSSDGDFSEDLGNDANGNLKVWTLGLAAGYLPKLSPYSTTSVPHPVKIYQVDTTGAKMLVYLSINIQPELYEWIIFRSPILKYKCENVMFFVRWLKSWYKVQSIKFGSLSISGVQPSGKIGRFWGRTPARKRALVASSWFTHNSPLNLTPQICGHFLLHLPCCKKILIVWSYWTGHCYDVYCVAKIYFIAGLFGSPTIIIRKNGKKYNFLAGAKRI